MKQVKTGRRALVLVVTRFDMLNALVSDVMFIKYAFTGPCTPMAGERRIAPFKWKTPH